MQGVCVIAFVPDHQHDVFVSYAHVDNMPFPGTEKGWVSLLVETLEILLAQKLGRREGFSLWMDRDLSRHKHLTPEILNSLSDTATLVVILSPGYLASEWCLREKDTFLKLMEAKQEAGSRVFIVERDQVEWQERPTEFGDLLGYRFWVPGEGDGTPLILGMPFPDPKNPRQMPYFDELTRLACNLADELKELRTLAERKPEQAASAPSSPTEGASSVAEAPNGNSGETPKGTVLLAEVTDDLDARNTALRTYLEQAGFEVLPDSWYPRDPEGFRAAVDADLVRSAVFVQLLSTLPGKRPPGLEEGYVSAQHTQALAANKSVVQWRNPELDVASVEDEAHRALLERETVMAVSVDELQREVVRLATPKEPTVPAAAPGMGDLVFVNAEAGDMELAQQVSEALEAQGLSCALPLPGGSPAEVREDLENNLMFCDALVIVQGTTPSRWVRDQLLLLRKVAWKRDEPLRALAIFEGPPEEKEPLRFGQPGLITLNARAGMADSTLTPLLEALQATAGAGDPT